MKKNARILTAFIASLFVWCASAETAAAAGQAGKTYNVLVINFDPIFPEAGGKRQHELLSWWNDPHRLAGEFAADLEEVSGGCVRYSIAEWVDLYEMPMNTDRLSYDRGEYYSTLMAANEATHGAYWEDSRWHDWGFSFDYDYYMKLFGVYDRVDSGELDEVWIFTGPMIGAFPYETRMIGRGAYWCNSPGLEKDCRPFIVYGFNYERGVGEMLEDAGHRAESILSSIFGRPDYEKPYES